MAFVPVYILILAFTIVIDYVAGIYLEKIQDRRKKKFFLVLSLLANIGVLAFFKYWNFLNANLGHVLGFLGQDTPLPFLNILLPIGLSFHTFQAMSYTIEVYRGTQKAERHFGIYSLYVMFYPQLVAGPIERPNNLLHQFHEVKHYDFENMKSGLMQMAFGMFKKVVIADRLSELVDPVFAAPGQYGGLASIVAAFFYAIQIYCDFSGYSDIAIGSARTMGFNLMQNFNIPYLSKSVREFWSRWHISLSTWFRDYVYIPLGGNRVKRSRIYFNLMVVFLLSGLWHGANWTFVIWGAIHGLYIITGMIIDHSLKGKNILRNNNWLIDALKVLFTFTLVCFAWIFFRSANIHIAWQMIEAIFTASWRNDLFCLINTPELIFSFVLIILLMVKEKYLLTIPTRNTFLFYNVFILLALMCYVFGVFNNNQFIYFQF